MNIRIVKKILLASSAWITWGILYSVWAISVNRDDGTGSAMGWISVGFIFFIISLLVSLLVSLSLIIGLKPRTNQSVPSPAIHTCLFLINYSFGLYSVYLVYNEGVTFGLLLQYGLPILLTQNILLIIYLLRKKQICAQA